MARLFFSYSHRDEACRDELEKHLAVLKRQGQIQAWHDRKIVPGQPIDHSIDQHLRAADIILLLVSPDFLHSDYCYDVEVHEAMERHATGACTVVPVIIRPCDWHAAPFGHLLALPKDGKPVSLWSDTDQAFLDVTNGVKAVLADRESRPGAKAPGIAHQVASRRRAGDVRIPRKFSDLDQDDFLQQAFNTITEYFEGSLAELERSNPGAQGRLRRLDASRFTAVAYRDGRAISRCTIWKGGRSLFPRGIGYVENDSGETSSFNESLSVEVGSQSLYLKPMGMPFLGGQREQTMTADGAADYLWELFLRRLRE